MNDEGLNRSAILMMSLGADEAAEVFKYLAPREVQKLGAAMAKLKDVSRDSIGSVLDVFQAEARDKTTVGIDSDEYIRSVLRKALGDDKAANLIDRILQQGDTSGIDGLKWMDSASVAELIKNEHPQIVATILVHLEPEQASEILGFLAERQRSDVILRIATLDGVQPGALRELNDVLNKLVAGGSGAKSAQAGGVRAAAEILNLMSSSHETAVIEGVREYNAELAQAILEEMFVFEDLLELDERAVQLVLREVQGDALVVALKGASEELRERVFANMSQRAAETMREDFESKGPVRISEVETQQKEILKVVRRLADEGQIALGGKGDDSFI